MDLINCYEDASRADAYATLEFANTYYLAYRDLPAIISEHVTGTKALDFGCGTGRSTRFLRKLGFNVTGVKSLNEFSPSTSRRSLPPFRRGCSAQRGRPRTR